VVNDLPPAVQLPTAAAFWDARDWLIGTASEIERTSDGGRTFRVVLRTPRPVQSLEAAGPGRAVARLDGGQAVRTLDGGRRWKLVRDPYLASFATRRIGLGVRSAPGARPSTLSVLGTRDGGRTWQPRASPCRGVLAFSAIVDAVTPTLAWIVCLGQPSAGNQAKQVFRTANGGTTWRAVAGMLAGYGYPAGLAVAGSGFGLMWESRGTLLVTRDGGRSWHGRPRLAVPEKDGGAGGAVLAGTRGIVLLRAPASARVLATDDAGRTWHVVRRW
jgi:photosystem II stability/assembly factor-like uncharacterized protein